MSEEKNPILFPQEQLWQSFFPFIFLANEELKFVLCRKLLTHLSGPILSPGTEEEQKSR